MKTSKNHPSLSIGDDSEILDDDGDLAGWYELLLGEG